MAKKNRKHQHMVPGNPPIPGTVGYVRVSVANKEKASSVENQKFIIELWGDQHQVPITHYYIDNGYSGRIGRFAHTNTKGRRKN